jgi:ABC-2 type transport system permease protein
MSTRSPDQRATTKPVHGGFLLGMKRSFSSEWVKMARRRLFYGSYFAITGVVILTTIVAVVGAHRKGHGSGSVMALSQASGLSKGLTDSVILLGAVALSIAAAQFGGEFSHGTLRNLLVRQPSRAALATGKGTAVISFIVGAVVVAALFGMAIAFLAADIRGIPTGAWGSGTGLAHFGTSLGDLALSATGFAIIGMILGVLLESSVLAIGTGLALLLPVESILTSAAPGSARWLPGQLLQAIAKGGDGHASFLAALATSAAYLFVLVVGTLVVFTLQDVTT